MKADKAHIIRSIKIARGQLDGILRMIRQKIEDDRAVPVYIRTISNLGYQFMPNISVKKDSL